MRRGSCIPVRQVEGPSPRPHPTTRPLDPQNQDPISQRPYEPLILCSGLLLELSLLHEPILLEPQRLGHARRAYTLPAESLEETQLLPAGRAAIWHGP
jgi:hypothetical protein